MVLRNDIDSVDIRLHSNRVTRTNRKAPRARGKAISCEAEAGRLSPERLVGNTAAFQLSGYRERRTVVPECGRHVDGDHF